MSETIIRKIDNETVVLELNKDIYKPEAIRATSYKFTDRCYIKIDEPENGRIQVYFNHKQSHDIPIEQLAKEFCNELIDQQVRLDIEQRFSDIRDAIVKKAFSSIQSDNNKGKTS